MDIGKFFQSKIFKIAVWSFGGLAVAALVFAAGMAVGFKKASFSFRWGENYHRNFGGPQGGFMGDFRGNDFMDANGTSGQIMKIGTSTLLVKGRGNMERVVAIGDDTAIVRFRENIELADLKVNDYVVIIGEPGELGQVIAKFIRVMPAPPPEAGPVPPQPPMSSTQK